MRDHFVYWVHDTEGELLYVGVTKRPQQRYDQHMNGNGYDGRDGWFDEFETKWRFRGPLPKGTAYALEAQEIVTKRPVFNVHGIPDRKSRSGAGVVAAYFRKRGKAYPVGADFAPGDHVVHVNRPEHVLTVLANYGRAVRVSAHPDDIARFPSLARAGGQTVSLAYIKKVS
jgi:hypothetical protein